MRQEKHILKVETFTEEHPETMLWFRVYDDPARLDITGEDVMVTWRGKTVEVAEFANKILSGKDVEFQEGEFYLIPVPKTFNVKMDLNGS